MADASEHFWRAFCHTGTIMASCACGVTYFCVYNNDGNFDEGELEDLRQKAAHDPKRFVELDCSGVSAFTIGGKQFVEGCECGGLKNYEDFIWAWRSEILEYITARLNAEQETIDFVHTRLTRAASALQRTNTPV